MHLIDAFRLIKIQVIRLYNENLSSKEISRYLNRVNPRKFSIKSGVSLIFNEA
jgi:hypothetical protein